MTLGIAWVRVVGGIRELVVASDSRLSGGQYWDANPKIVLLPRSDSVISFAGSTADAYPLMLQAYNTIKMHQPAEKRFMDLPELKGHLLRMFNHSRKFITRLPHGQSIPDSPEAIFMLSGFSWRTRSFRIWLLHYDQSIGGYTFRPTTEWRGQEDEAYKLVAYVGDRDAVYCAKKELVELLRERQKLTASSLDMEPFEVLRDMIRNGRFPTVGGPIQLVKIYEHANVAPMGVYWPNKASGVVSVLGRPLMDYEVTKWGVIDPDHPDRARPMDSELGDAKMDGAI